MLQTLLATVAAYMLGCVVGAYYVVRFRAGHDIRAMGSGNAGARNVLRSGDRTSAAITLLWDAFKGALAVWVAQRLAHTNVAIALAFVAVVLGHVRPAQLQFRGGKGVATAIGASLAILPRLFAGGTWPLIAGAVVAWTIVVRMHYPGKRI